MATDLRLLSPHASLSPATAVSPSATPASPSFIQLPRTPSDSPPTLSLSPHVLPPSDSSRSPCEITDTSLTLPPSPHLWPPARPSGNEQLEAPGLVCVVARPSCVFWGEGGEGGGVSGTVHACMCSMYSCARTCEGTSLSRSLARSFARELSLTLTLTLSHTNSVSLFLSHSLTLSHSLSG